MDRPCRVATVRGFDLDIEAGNVDPVWYGTLPTVLYNKMLKPLLPLTVKGVIWYQGEANVSRPEQYKTLFPLLIESWRRYFRNPDMPFYYVQIAPYEYQGVNSAELREVQLEVMQSVPNTGMAVALDVGERDTSIHLAKRYSANGSPIGRSTTITDIRRSDAAARSSAQWRFAAGTPY